MDSTILILRCISTLLLIASFFQFLIYGLILRPRRMKSEIVNGRPFHWKEHAGHTIGQRIYQLAVIESVLGSGILIFLKING